MERRQLVAVGSLLVLVVLGGCSAAGSLDMEPATDATVATEASRSVPEPDDSPTESDSVVRAAIENGTVDGRSQEPLVDHGLPYRSDGRYYNISSSVVDRQPGTAYRLGIDYNGTAPPNATVAYENLTARDRAAVDAVLPPVPVRAEPGPDYHFSATYNATERDQSAMLAPDVEAVRYRGETYPLVVTEIRSMILVTRQYTATVVANSTAAYAEHLRSEYRFELSGLSDAERAVVTAAINETYYAETDDDEAFASVLNRFQRHEAVHSNEYRGVWLVRYRGESYVAELSYESFDID